MGGGEGGYERKIVAGGKRVMLRERERNITSQSRFVFFVRRFPGVPFQDTVFLMPTTNCLVSLSEPVSEFYLCIYVRIII